MADSQVFGEKKFIVGKKYKCPHTNWVYLACKVSDPWAERGWKVVLFVTEGFRAGLPFNMGRPDLLADFQLVSR